MCVLSGGGHPGGGQHHRAGDVASPPAGLALHPVLRVQAVQREEEQEKEKEKERPRPERPSHIIAAPPFTCLPRITPLTP